MYVPILAVADAPTIAVADAAFHLLQPEGKRVRRSILTTLLIILSVALAKDPNDLTSGKVFKTVADYAVLRFTCRQTVRIASSSTR